MNTRRYLERIRRLKVHAELIQEDIDALRCIAYSITATLKEDVVQRSGTSDKIGNAAISVVVLEKKLDLLDAKLDEMRKCAYGMMEVLTDREREVLCRRYFANETWGNIAKSMYYSKQTIFNIQKKALQKMQKRT